MKFNLPQKIEYVLDTLISNGHSAYIVGGCVRDLLCGKVPHDYDITTSATPIQTQGLFEKTIATGIKHGTVTVIIDGTQIEVTTFRTEATYTDSRHPDGVNFVRDVTEDLARRDFSVNAMCYNNQDGLIDCFGGQDDIKNRLLRAVGDAKKRFTEDALRILRLFRFSATLEFTIESKTLNAALECAPLLKNISAERIFTELQKAAGGQNVEVIIPLLKTDALYGYHLKNCDLSKVSSLENNQNLRTFALLSLASTDLPKTLDSLKCSNIFKDYCTKMQFFTQNLIKDSKPSIKNALNFAEYDIVYDALLYYRGILNIDIKKHKALLYEIIEKKEPYKISHLAICGKDITALGFDGKEVGEKLEVLLQKVTADPTANTREKLLNFICN